MLTTLDREDKFVYGSSTYLSEVRRSSALSSYSPAIGGRSSVLGIGSVGTVAGGATQPQAVSGSLGSSGGLTGLGSSGLTGLESSGLTGLGSSSGLTGLGSRLGVAGSSSGLLLGSVGGGIGGEVARTSSSPSFVRTSPNRIRFGGSEPYLSSKYGAAARPTSSGGNVTFAPSSYGASGTSAAVPSAYGGGGVRVRRKYWY